MKNLVVVVDMINGFVKEGALADQRIGKITPNILKLIAKEKNATLIAFKDEHDLKDAEFKIYPVHCLKGTEESELIDELKGVDFNYVIGKDTTNGFITKQFQELIKNNEYDNVYVTGCLSEVCVKNFVDSYLDYIKENNLKTKIGVYEDCCYTFDGENHEAEKVHEEAMTAMKEKGAQILNLRRVR